MSQPASLLPERQQPLVEGPAGRQQAQQPQAPQEQQQQSGAEPDDWTAVERRPRSSRGSSSHKAGSSQAAGAASQTNSSSRRASSGSSSRQRQRGAAAAARLSSPPPSRTQDTAAPALTPQTPIPQPASPAPQAHWPSMALQQPPQQLVQGASDWPALQRPPAPAWRKLLQRAHAGSLMCSGSDSGSGSIGGGASDVAEAVTSVTLDASLLNEAFCPITQEPLKEPVVAADGHTYERAAIQGEPQEGLGLGGRREGEGWGGRGKWAGGLLETLGKMVVGWGRWLAVWLRAGAPLRRDGGRYAPRPGGRYTPCLGGRYVPALVGGTFFVLVGGTLQSCVSLGCHECS